MQLPSPNSQIHIFQTRKIKDVFVRNLAQNEIKILKWFDRGRTWHGKLYLAHSVPPCTVDGATDLCDVLCSIKCDQR